MPRPRGVNRIEKLCLHSVYIVYNLVYFVNSFVYRILKGVIEIKTLNDYVEWMANSMHMQLTEDQIKEITNRLINSKRYNDMLRELEIWIMSVKDRNN